MALKTVRYLCFGCRTEHAVRIKEEEEVPRRTMQKTCPNCHKYRRMHIAGCKPLTRRDVQ